MGDPKQGAFAKHQELGIKSFKGHKRKGVHGTEKETKL